MTHLPLRLDDTDFAELAQLGQALIPTLAPTWTDHNVHDPGIMLIELMAWIADAQIYSLGRLRRDERLAYARLLGVELRGAQPARALLWPGTVSFPSGTVVAEQSAVTSADPKAPTFRVERAIALSEARLHAVLGLQADGTVLDFTRVNAQLGATFQPFSDPPHARDELALELTGVLLPSVDQTATLSVGFAIERNTEERFAGDAPRLQVLLRDSGGDRPLQIVEDQTGGLLQSGALLLALTRDRLPYDATFRLVIRGAGALPRGPRVARVALNVLPILQQRGVVEEELGTGLPDQTFTLRTGQLLYSTQESSLQVEVADGTGFALWQSVDDLHEAGPQDRVYELAAASATVRFGNGVNGCCPAQGATVRFRYEVSDGSRGLVPAQLRWRVHGIAMDYGSNLEASFGGEDTRGLAQLQSLARQELTRRHPLVTDDDLSAAALALADLHVARAIELAPEAACPRPHGTRVLLVVSADSADGGAAESTAWRAAIQGRLAVRLPLGQRLEVVGPRYVTVRVQATLMAAAQRDLEEVAASVRQTLQANLALVASADREPWPFGRKLTVNSVKGWLRALDGVARVLEVRLLVDGSPVSGGVITLGSRGLPLLELPAADVVVDRYDLRARRS